MILAACYTVFDGTELLEAAMKSIAQHVDFFVIKYQTVSNNGRPMGLTDRMEMVRLMECKTAFGKPLYVIDFTPHNFANAKENERIKHNQMIDNARALGATHFLMGACDHFYDDQEFHYSKRLVEAMDYDATFTQMYTYYKNPTWQLYPIEEYYMPFICKLYPETRIEKVRPFPLLVDPSVQMNTCKKWYLFKEFQIMLHHYSMIRRNIEWKFTNAASPWKPAQIDEFTQEWNEYSIHENPGLKYFKGRKVKLVRDYFNLNAILEPR